MEILSALGTISIFLFAAIFAFTATDARSLLNRIQNPVESTTPFQNNEDINLSGTNSRVKRSMDECTVHPDTAAIVDNKHTFLDFDYNVEEPPTPSNQSLTCPDNNYTAWWPGTELNLRAACPWIWEIKNVGQVFGFEIYPKYVIQAHCLCEDCVNAKAMRCTEVEREEIFYKKMGCDGEHPILKSYAFNVTVGCVCV